MNGWDPAISDLWGAVCIRDRRNCGSANLGDGRMTLEFQAELKAPTRSRPQHAAGLL